MSSIIKEIKYRVIASCWVPDRNIDGIQEKQHRFNFHDKIYTSESEAREMSEALMHADIDGQLIQVSMESYTD